MLEKANYGAGGAVGVASESLVGDGNCGAGGVVGAAGESLVGDGAVSVSGIAKDH